MAHTHHIMEKNDMEHVLVVPTALLESRLSAEADLIAEDIPGILDLIRRHHQFVERDYAEYAAEYKQIIPYAVLMQGGKYFLTQRLRKQTEKRLHGLYSIGLGGHINPSEEALDDVIAGGLRRELWEEVGLQDFSMPPCAGVIHDRAAEVSNYHLGLVYPILVRGPIQVREVSKMTGVWADAAELTARLPEMETWSQIVWSHRNRWDPAAQA